jgi:NAD(P)H dehydrogenase (quinone)
VVSSLLEAALPSTSLCFLGVHITVLTICDIRIAETLSDEVLAKMHAPSKPSYPVITPSELTEFDAFIFGIPTRYGNFPAQWKVCL